LVAATRPGNGTVLDDEVWVTARLVATAAAEARTDRVDERSALTGVLDRVRRGLEDPDGAWDDSLATVLVTRPPRFRLKTGLDAGSGHLLWAVDDAARERWDYPVDHLRLLRVAGPAGLGGAGGAPPRPYRPPPPRRRPGAPPVHARRVRRLPRRL